MPATPTPCSGRWRRPATVAIDAPDTTDQAAASPPAQPEPGPEPEPDVDPTRAEAAWSAITERIGDDGTVDVETAIEAFSRVVAPLPGAPAPADDEPIVLESPSVVVGWIAQHLDELTPEQREAVAAALSAAGTEPARMGVDGGSPVPLLDDASAAPGEAIDASPTWSPDGTRLAFISDRDGNSEIYVVGADGTALARLTDSPAGDFSPAWG